MLDETSETNALNATAATTDDSPLSDALRRLRGTARTVALFAQVKLDEKNRMDEEGATALHYASVGGHAQIVEVLAEAKADLNAQKKNGATPIFNAAANGHEKVVELLARLSADVDKADRVIAVSFSSLSTWASLT